MPFADLNPLTTVSPFELENRFIIHSMQGFEISHGLFRASSKSMVMTASFQLHCLYRSSANVNDGVVDRLREEVEVHEQKLRPRYSRSLCKWQNNLASFLTPLSAIELS